MFQRSVGRLGFRQVSFAELISLRCATEATGIQTMVKISLTILLKTHYKLSIFGEQNVVKTEPLIDTSPCFWINWIQITALLSRVHKIGQDSARFRQNKITINQGRNLVCGIQLQESLREVFSL